MSQKPEAHLGEFPTAKTYAEYDKKGNKIETNLDIALNKEQNEKAKKALALEQESVKKEQRILAKERKEAENQERIAEVIKKTAEYIELIKANSTSAINQLGIALDMDPKWRRVESILHRLLEAKNLEPDSKAPELVEALAASWALDETTSMSGWIHSVCHFFENYQKTKKEYNEPSLLDNKRWGRAAEILAKEVLTRAADVKKYPLQDKYNRFNLPRVFNPLLTYNLDTVDVANLEIFPLKPEHPDYSAIADQQSDGGGGLDLTTKEFFSASSPKDLILRLIRIGKPLPTSDKAKALLLLSAVKDEVGLDQMSAYLNKAYPVNDQPVDLKTLETNVAAAKEAKEKAEGLFVDVDATLIIDGKINARVLQAMEKALKQGISVTVFTGGSPETASEQLTALEVPKQFLDVKHKADYMGKELEWLIDDTDAELQGFKTPQYHQYSPDNAALINFSKTDKIGLDV